MYVSLQCFGQAAASPLYPPRPQKRPTRWRCGRGSVVVRCFSGKRLNGGARFGLGSRDWTRRPSRIFRSGRVLPLAICTEVADHESSGDGILPFFLLLRIGSKNSLPCSCVLTPLSCWIRTHKLVHTVLITHTNIHTITYKITLSLAAGTLKSDLNRAPPVRRNFCPPRVHERAHASAQVRANFKQ